MYSKYRFIIISIIVFFFPFCYCDKKHEPISPVNQTYETPYGVVTQIDDYPLFTLNYTSDYKFDEYLQTGQIPLYTLNKSKGKNFSCTCFSAFGGEYRLFGRNYDWSESSTYFILFTNPPNGYSSVSTVDLSFFNYNHDEPPSFSDNQSTLRILPYYPFDGMNEMGVAIGMNALDEAQSPNDPSKVTIGELQLIRLVLDYSSSTQEAISLIQQYNIRMEDPPIHYLIADSSGHSAIIEFVNGEMKMINNSNPWQVTTNFVITGLTNPQNAPCWRYRYAYEKLSSNNGILSESEAVNLLQEVSLSITRWSTVFNLKSGQLQIAMGRDYENLHQFTCR
jgi:choloylglycine hydrolase